MRRSGDMGWAPASRAIVFTAFLLLAGAAALAVNEVVEPGGTRHLLLAGATGALVGVPGLIHRGFWPVSLLFLALGAYILARVVVPLPEDIFDFREELAFYGEVLRFGAETYTRVVFPLSISAVPGLRLLVILSAYLVIAVASVVALGGRYVVLGSGVVLSLIAVTFTVDGEQSRVPAVLLVLALTMLILLAAQSAGGREAGRRYRVGMAGGLISIVLGTAVLWGFPGLAAAGWEDWKTLDPFDSGPGNAHVYSWRRNYPALLNPEENIRLMVVESGLPSYWRANTLDFFTGYSWLGTSVYNREVGGNREGEGSREGEGGSAFRVVETGGPLPPGEVLTQRFDLESINSAYLFSGGIPREIQLESSVRVGVSEAGTLRSRRLLKPPFSYRVKSLVPTAGPAELVGRGRDYPGPIRQTYLQSLLPPASEADRALSAGGTVEALLSEVPRPGSEFSGLYTLNEQIVGGAEDPYEIALRVERYLREEYQYSLAVPDAERASPYAAFLLENGIGYCQHFAGSMVLLLRLNGVPARVAVGFGTGSAEGEDRYVVGTNNAHSWVEVFFPGVGWLPFEPTPGNGLPGPGASSTSEGFEDPFPDEEEAAGPETGPAASSSRLPEEGGPQPPVPSSPEGQVPEAEGAGAGAWALAGALVLGLAGWPMLRKRVREWGVTHGSLSGRGAASLALLRKDLRAHGFPVSEAWTCEEITAMVADHLGVDISAACTRVQAVVFGGRGGEEELRRAEDARRQVTQVLRRRAGKLRTLATWYGITW